TFTARDAIALVTDLGVVTASTSTGDILIADLHGLTVNNVTGPTNVTVTADSDLTVKTIQGATVTLSAGGNVIDGNGSGTNNVTAIGNAGLLTQGWTVGTINDAIEVQIGGTLTVGESTKVNGVSINISGTDANNTLSVILLAPGKLGKVLFNGQQVK